MRSSPCGLLAGLLGWGCLCWADTVGAFGVGIGVIRLALGEAALPVLRGVCVR